MKLIFSRRIGSLFIVLAVLASGAAYVAASDGMTAAQATPISITANVMGVRYPFSK
jgi:hypothetical protein